MWEKQGGGLSGYYKKFNIKNIKFMRGNEYGKKIVEIGLRESLLRDLDNIAIRYGVTKERWIKDVPAELCQQCGEKYFSPDVYKAMENLAKAKEKPIKHVAIDVFRFVQSATGKVNSL